jgi:hypothetical protein
MGKIIFWIVVFFVVLLALRLANVAATKVRRDKSRGNDDDKRRELEAEPTVRCAVCGTYLPKSEAAPSSDGYRCGEPGCTRRR